MATNETVKSDVTAPTETTKARKTAVKQSDVPSYNLVDALRVAQAMNDNFAKKPTKPMNVAIALNLTVGSTSFRMLLGASAAYGLTEGAHTSEMISLTDLGKRCVAPTVEGMAETAKREAFMRPRIMREFLQKYNSNKLPSEKIAKNVLEDLGVPTDSAATTFALISEGATQLGLIVHHKGGLYVDLDSPAEESDAETVTADESRSQEDDMPEKSPQLEQSTMPKGFKEMPEMNNRVFITHGKNLTIVEQLKSLLKFGNFTSVVAAEHETISKPVPDKVMDDMRSCYAAIIHVGKEIKLLDQEEKEHIFVNQNVLIEIGAAMALYGRRFILLVEQGATLPSNLQGLYEVRYEGEKLDHDATMKLLNAFNDFKG